MPCPFQVIRWRGKEIRKDQLQGSRECGVLMGEDCGNSSLVATRIAFSIALSRDLCLWASAFLLALEAFWIAGALEDEAVPVFEGPGSEGPEESDDNWVAAALLEGRTEGLEDIWTKMCRKKIFKHCPK